MKKSILLVLSFCGLCLLNGCGGGGNAAAVSNSTNPSMALVITSPATPAGTVQTAYGSSDSGFLLTASGGKMPYAWSWAAAAGFSVPAGLNLSNGLISGTPATAGSYNVIMTVTDSESPAAQKSANYTIAINNRQASSLTITSGAPPGGTYRATYGSVHRVLINGQYHTVFGFLLTASGGTGHYSWAWTAAKGSLLPPGLTCCSGTFGGPWPPMRFVVRDIIYGTPTGRGTYHIVLTVTDSGTPPAQVSANYTIVINNPPPPVINTTPAPAIGTLNVPYVGFTFTATQGLPPLTWRETGVLPPGVVLSNSGVLSGTPTAAGSFPITVMVQDSLGRNAVPQDFTIQVLSKGFTPIGSMGTARNYHTATLLSNGKVLFTGGASATADLATAELFDPTTGSFSPTGSMESTRVSHTATLLSDGKVLITGGYGGGTTFATAEIFDPTSGTFAPTGSMESARQWHTATLLKNGKVLVTGGVDATGHVVATAELFDPASGTFAPLGKMGSIRYFHTATLLNNGKVLVTGGGNTAELYDPATGGFSPTGTMETARYSHTATLLNDGKVLVTGGYDAGGNALATAELFDSTRGTFSPTGSMESARYLHTATLLGDGKVLEAGGLKNASTPLSAAELFDPTNRTFTATADMTAARSAHTATLLTNGEVLVTGGEGVSSVLATAELYQ